MELRIPRLFPFPIPLPFIAQGEKTIGAAEKRRYDLPLAHSAGSGFLVLLIGMMTFLAVLSLAASFVLGALSHRWTSGLEGRATVEIPATDPDGKILSPETVDRYSRRIADYLGAQSAIKSVEILDKKDITALVAPWLGDAPEQIEGMPLPALIALEIKDVEPEKITALEKRVRAIAPGAKIDAHQDWLSDILRLTRALGFAAILMTGLTAFATLIAVAGGVRSRMAEYKSDIEILHLMGAGDAYIARQFQRHAAHMAFIGSCGGLLGAGITMLIVWLISGQTKDAIIPDFSLGTSDTLLMVSALPAAVAIAWFSARWSVLRSLAGMP